jgi:regulator of protease activity HflC (stomatin/prohibitin superfamily)
MLKTVFVSLDERVVVLQDGIPVRALGPGRHRLWGFSYTERRWSTRALVFEMPAELRAVLPETWYGEIVLGPSERAVLWHDGKPHAFLKSGTHRYFLADDTVRVQVFSVLEDMPVLTAELAEVIPRDAYVDAVVLEHERGLLYVQGRLVRTLAPGRYVFWTTRESPVSILKVDMRAAQITIAGQELMTRDKVTLRLTLTVEHAIADPFLTATSSTNLHDAIYLIVQLAAREFVAGVTLDELLGGRDAMARALESDAVSKAAKLGIRIDRVGVKDVVLPGEMKTLLNKVIEAEKEAAANVILRREETAATRSLANTAKVMAEQPLLLRLKELESMKEIASKIRELRVVASSDSLGALLSSGLLSDGKHDQS